MIVLPCSPSQHDGNLQSPSLHRVASKTFGDTENETAVNLSRAASRGGTYSKSLTFGK